MSWFQPQAGEFYDGLSNEAYHRGPGVSSSAIKRVLKSPAHYRASLEAPEPQTAAMRLGTMRHTMLLEPETFDELYIVRPADLDGRTKAGKAWLSEARETGREVVSWSEHEGLVRFCAAVREHPLWSGIVEGGRPKHIERSYYWEDEGTGLLCKARTDVLIEFGDHNLILDLKSTKDSSPEQFARQAHRLGYHISASHYCRGVRSVTGHPCDFILVAAEYGEASEVNFYLLCTSNAVTGQQRLGDQECRKALALIAKCGERDEWPTATRDEVVPLELPRWAEREIEDESFEAEPF